MKFATIQKGALKVSLVILDILPKVKSAIHMLVPVLNDILNYEWPSDAVLGSTTVNIGVIDGGQALNAWAENAHAKIFFRVTTSVADIREKLNSLVGGRASIEVTSYNEPVVLSSAPLDFPTDQVAFNTDLPYFNRLSALKGKYLFGAGSIRNAHSRDEFVPKKELHDYRQALINLALKLCSSSA